MDENQGRSRQDIPVDALSCVGSAQLSACYLWASLCLLYMLVYCAVQVRKYDSDSYLSDGVEKRVGFIFGLIVLVALLPFSVVQTGSVVYVSSADCRSRCGLTSTSDTRR